MHVCMQSERRGERKDYGNKRIQNTEAGAGTTHTASASLLLLLPSTGAFIQGGQPKEGSWAQITPRLILTGFGLYTKAYKNNEMGFGST